MQFRLLIEYHGAGFAGWQVQPDQRTVQGELERAIRVLTGEAAVRVHAAGRTDTGVHASGQVACFRVERKVTPETVQRALNALTGDDLTIRRVDVVDDDFDPRRAARRRSYEYRVWNDRVRSPFWRPYAWHVIQPLDRAAMRAAAAHLVGEHDFTSFRAAGCDADHPVRRIFVSEIVTGNDTIVLYRVTATAFLRHMVRNIVGTLVEVGRGRRAADEMPELLAACNRDLAGATAPPHGLCLTRVEY
jgi:tRNA pseudouridine38-40 synthase